MSHICTDLCRPTCERRAEGVEVSDPARLAAQMRADATQLLDTADGRRPSYADLAHRLRQAAAEIERLTGGTVGWVVLVEGHEGTFVVQLHDARDVAEKDAKAAQWVADEAGAPRVFTVARVVAEGER